VGALEEKKEEKGDGTNKRRSRGKGVEREWREGCAHDGTQEQDSSSSQQASRSGHTAASSGGSGATVRVFEL
jgi:hypothetical protein